MHRHIIRTIDTERVWQVPKRVPIKFRKIFTPGFNIVLTVLSLSSFISLTIGALFVGLAGDKLLATYLAIGVLLSGIVLYAAITRLARALRLKREVLAGDHLNVFVIERSPIFKAIMSPELLKWLRRATPSGLRLVGDILKNYHRAAIDMRSRIRSEHASLPDDHGFLEHETNYRSGMAFIDKAEDFATQIRTITGINLTEHFTKCRDELRKWRQDVLDILYREHQASLRALDALR